MGAATDVPGGTGAGCVELVAPPLGTCIPRFLYIANGVLDCYFSGPLLFRLTGRARHELCFRSHKAVLQYVQDFNIRHYCSKKQERWSRLDFSLVSFLE